MTLLEYRIFHTVTQQGSFARAAQILHLTPSAISHAVSSMEEACGFALFVRGKGGVSLTRSGAEGRSARQGAHRRVQQRLRSMAAAAGDGVSGKISGRGD